MRNSSLRALLLVPGLLLLASCGPPWKVLMQSGPPSALNGQPQIITAVDMSQLLISGKTLQQEMGRRDAEEQNSLNAALNIMGTAFNTAVASSAGVQTIPAQGPPVPGEGLRVTARFIELDPGKYAFVYARDTVLVTNLVWTLNGQPVDEIQVKRVADANRHQASINERVQIVGRQTGQLAGRYYSSRQGR